MCVYTILYISCFIHQIARMTIKVEANNFISFDSASASCSISWQITTGSFLSAYHCYLPTMVLFPSFFPSLHPSKSQSTLVSLHTLAEHQHFLKINHQFYSASSICITRQSSKHRVILLNRGSMFAFQWREFSPPLSSAHRRGTFWSGKFASVSYYSLVKACSL